MKSKLAVLLDQRARTFEDEAEKASTINDKFFFMGKAEQAKQTIAAIDHVINGDMQKAVNALNGSTGRREGL